MDLRKDQVYKLTTDKTDWMTNELLTNLLTNSLVQTPEVVPGLPKVL
jgi:hypothetical protein